MQKLNNGFKNLIWFQTRTADQAFKILKERDKKSLNGKPNIFK